MTQHPTEPKAEPDPEQAPEPNFTIPRISDNELKLLALGIADGSVFCGWGIDPNHDAGALLPIIFLPLSLMSRQAMEEIRDNAGMLFAPIEKAMSRSVNGYPIFEEMHVLHKDDVPGLRKYVLKLKGFRDTFLRTQPADEEKPEGGDETIP